MTLSFYEFMTTVQSYSHGTAVKYENTMNQITPKIPLPEILTGDIDSFPLKALGRNLMQKTVRGTWRQAVRRFREYHEFLGTQIK